MGGGDGQGAFALTHTPLSPLRGLCPRLPVAGRGGSSRSKGPSRKPTARVTSRDDEEAASAGRAPETLRPDSPLTRLPGVGKAAVERFERLGVTNAGEAVFLFPGGSTTSRMCGRSAS
jgi:hypothetical protein